MKRVKMFFSRRRRGSSKRNQRAISSVIGAVIVFGMLFTLGFTFFYTLNQDQNIFQQSIRQNVNLIAQQNLEHLSVSGYSVGSQLAFYVNNTGITATIVSFWVLNATNNALLVYYNSTNLPSVLPHSIGAGQSALFTVNGITIKNTNQKYIIKVLTARGTTAVGLYPSGQLTSSAVNSLVAGGFGSLQMTFSTFNWYPYVSGPPATFNCGGQCNNYNVLCSTGAKCNGGPWVIDTAHPHSGSLMPAGTSKFLVPVAFSVNVTNDDPSLGTIVISSESNLWVIQTCDSGVTEGNCNQGNPVYVFYVMNVNPSTGAVLSTTQGSFSQIVIPYGVTKTIYYGAAYDLSLNSYTFTAITSANARYSQYYGQFSIFLLFAGTKVTPQATQVYGQNIPFESTTAADNLGWYSETPTACVHGVQSNFRLTVNDSIFSGASINQVVLNASAFTINSYQPPPSGWSVANNPPGFLTWSRGIIGPGTSTTFSWTGTPPPSTAGLQLILPITLYWSNGYVTVLQAATVCNVG